MQRTNISAQQNPQTARSNPNPLYRTQPAAGILSDTEVAPVADLSIYRMNKCCNTYDVTSHRSDVKRLMAFAPSPAKLCFCTSCRGYLTHVDRHVYAKVAVVGEMLRDVRVKYETIACVNSRLDTIVYASWCRLPSQPSLLSIQLEPKMSKCHKLNN